MFIPPQNKFLATPLEASANLGLQYLLYRPIFCTINCLIRITIIQLHHSIPIYRAYGTTQNMNICINVLYYLIATQFKQVLEELLPPTSDSQHNLRKRRHNITLPEKKGHLAAKNFIIRLLYKDTY